MDGLQKIISLLHWFFFDTMIGTIVAIVALLVGLTMFVKK